MVENPDEISLEDDGEVNPEQVVVEDDEPKENPDEIALEEEEEGEGIVSEEKAGCGCTGAPVNPDEIGLEMEDEDELMVSQVEETVEEKVAAKEEEKERTTRFLALSKPGFGKDFLQVRSLLVWFFEVDADERELQIIDIPTPAGFARPAPPPNPAPAPAAPTPTNADTPSDAPVDTPAPSTPRYHPTLYFDPHWLSIVRTFAPYLSLKPSPIPFPPPSSFDSLLSTSLDWVRSNVGEKGMQKVDEVQVFGRTAPATGEGRDDGMRESSCCLLGEKRN